MRTSNTSVLLIFYFLVAIIGPLGSSGRNVVPLYLVLYPYYFMDLHSYDKCPTTCIIFFLLWSTRQNDGLYNFYRVFRHKGW